MAPLPPSLTNHVFAHVGHGVELLLADLAGELLLGVAVDDLVVLVERPELLEALPARHALQRERGWAGRQGNVPRHGHIWGFASLKDNVINKTCSQHNTKSAPDLVASKPPKLKFLSIGWGRG